MPANGPDGFETNLRRNDLDCSRPIADLPVNIEVTSHATHLFTHYMGSASTPISSSFYVIECSCNRDDLC